MSRIRLNASKTATIAAGVALSDAIPFAEFAGAVVHMPAAWTAASIGFHVSSTLAGTYTPLYDDDGNLVQIDSPAVDQSYTFPDAVFPCMFIKLWSQDGSAGDTNQVAEASLLVDLKA